MIGKFGGDISPENPDPNLHKSVLTGDTSPPTNTLQVDAEIPVFQDTNRDHLRNFLNTEVTNGALAKDLYDQLQQKSLDELSQTPEFKQQFAGLLKQEITAGIDAEGWQNQSMNLAMHHFFMHQPNRQPDWQDVYRDITLSIANSASVGNEAKNVLTSFEAHPDGLRHVSPEGIEAFLQQEVSNAQLASSSLSIPW